MLNIFNSTRPDVVSIIWYNVVLVYILYTILYIHIYTYTLNIQTVYTNLVYISSLYIIVNNFMNFDFENKRLSIGTCFRF